MTSAVHTSTRAVHLEGSAVETCARGAIAPASAEEEVEWYSDEEESGDAEVEDGSEASASVAPDCEDEDDESGQDDTALSTTSTTTTATDDTSVFVPLYPDLRPIPQLAALFKVGNRSALRDKKRRLQHASKRRKGAVQRKQPANLPIDPSALFHATTAAVHQVEGAANPDDHDTPLPDTTAATPVQRNDRAQDVVSLVGGLATGVVNCTRLRKGGTPRRLDGLFGRRSSMFTPDDAIASGLFVIAAETVVQTVNTWKRAFELDTRHRRLAARFPHEYFAATIAFATAWTTALPSLPQSAECALEHWTASVEMDIRNVHELRRPRWKSRRHSGPSTVFALLVTPMAPPEDALRKAGITESRDAIEGRRRLYTMVWVTTARAILRAFEGAGVATDACTNDGNGSPSETHGVALRNAQTESSTRQPPSPRRLPSAERMRVYAIRHAALVISAASAAGGTSLAMLAAIAGDDQPAREAAHVALPRRLLLALQSRLKLASVEPALEGRLPLSKKLATEVEAASRAVQHALEDARGCSTGDHDETLVPLRGSIVPRLVATLSDVALSCSDPGDLLNAGPVERLVLRMTTETASAETRDPAPYTLARFGIGWLSRMRLVRSPPHGSDSASWHRRETAVEAVPTIRRACVVAPLHCSASAEEVARAVYSTEEPWETALCVEWKKALELLAQPDTGTPSSPHRPPIGYHVCRSTVVRVAMAAAIADALYRRHGVPRMTDAMPILV